MNDENNIENVPGANVVGPRCAADDPSLPTQPPETTTLNSGRALVGKIARLPDAIRNQINQRLLDGQSGPEIAVWLNELPAVNEILATKFDGKPINPQNLSSWRQIGFRRWLDEKLSSTKDLGDHAANIIQAAGGKLAPAAAAVASGKVLNFLQTVGQDTSPDAIVKHAFVAAHLAKTEQNNARIEIARERLRQAELHLLLKRDKHQRDDVAIGRSYLQDARAREIEASDATNNEKIEILGLHRFGDDWEQRLVPEPDEPKATPDSDTTQPLESNAP